MVQGAEANAHREQELPWADVTHRSRGNVVDTKRPVVAGADQHPGWHALRKLAARITTPLLPDDYLHLANPLWSARELRGRILRGAPRDRRLRDAGHQAGLGLHLRLPAGPVHRHRAAGRRALALAVVFADLEPGRAPAGRRAP